jgi:hypothetical protein
MDEAKERETWFRVAVGLAIIGCVGLIACVGFIGYSVMYTVPKLIEANYTEPVPSRTSRPAVTAALTPDSEPLQDGGYVGMWKYHDRWVWIKITPQGQVFQCRIAPDGTVYKSEGRLVEGDQIVWEEIWGVDIIAREADSITLDGEYGKFEYELTDEEMDPACEPPF